MRWEPLGSAGGFSGSAVWCGRDASGTPILALKLWPEAMADSRLVGIHLWMKQAAHLPFVPHVLRTNDGGTVHVEAGRVWDLCRWMPGVVSQTRPTHQQGVSLDLQVPLKTQVDAPRNHQPEGLGPHSPGQRPGLQDPLNLQPEGLPQSPTVAALQAAGEKQSQTQGVALGYGVPALRAENDPNATRGISTNVILTGLVSSACSALAALHAVWRPKAPRLEPMPGVLRRLRILDDWDAQRSELLAIREPTYRRGLDAVARLEEPCRRILRPWVSKPVPVQPCLCDVHRDHILFANGDVSGVIDYGAMKIDHIGIDLARYLCDVCGESDDAFASGLASYCDAGGILDVPSSFIRHLECTAQVCAMIGWARRFRAGSAGSGAVQQRVERLAGRLDSIRGF